MPRPDRRRFTLADLMALIAVVAIAFPLARWVREPYQPSSFTHTSVEPANWIFWAWMKEPSCFLAALMVALIPLRWIGPRPPASRVILQPGGVACLAGAGAMVVGLTLELAKQATETMFLLPGSPRSGFANLWYWYSAINTIPLTIVGAWTALALGGRWSPEPSWIDRVGRILGVFWIAWLPVQFFWAPLQVWLPYKE